MPNGAGPLGGLPPAPCSLPRSCWTYETALLLGQPVPEELPETVYHQYFAPDYTLNVAAHRVMEDGNKREVRTCAHACMHGRRCD